MDKRKGKHACWLRLLTKMFLSAVSVVHSSRLLLFVLQVTLIPTHDSEVMREWYQETHEKQQDLNIMVLASSSTVVMQDESFPACKIEL